jgi:hypothetical protein
MESYIFVILEILRYLIPTLLVIFAMWLMFRFFFSREERFRKAQIESGDRRVLAKLRRKNSGIITPIRLQAYERIILLLDRITPDNLVMRLRAPGVGSGEMQGILLQSVRDEFEHNMSQQLYISDEAWELVKKAKEEVIQLINNSGAEMKEGSNGIDLCRRILERSAGEEIYPTLRAIHAIKSEIRHLF